MRKLAIFSTLFLCLVPYASAKIVWMSDWEIFVMEDDSSKVQRLTYNDIYDETPRWAPNGKYIAFGREQERETSEQNHDLFLMNVDGTQERKLTTYTGLDVSPAWSPDSQHIAFMSTRGDWDNIYIIDVETQEVRELAHNMNGHHAGIASWSPDGKKIIYVSTRSNPFEETIYIVNSDGKNPRRLFRPMVAHLYSLDWSPDGKHFLHGESKYVNNRLISDKIVIRTKDGIAVKELETPSLAKWAITGACWMGTRHVLIAAIEDYRAPDGGQSDILRYTIATGEIINLTNSPRDNDDFPDWIDDAALAVSPADKLTLQWGVLKQIN